MSDGDRKKAARTVAPRGAAHWVALAMAIAPPYLGPEVNSAGDELEPLPSPDGGRLIVMADGGLWKTTRAAGGWTPRRKLGPEVNANGSEIGALSSPSGRSLLFARDTGPPLSGELFVWRQAGDEAWPPDCPAPAAASTPPPAARPQR